MPRPLTPVEFEVGTLIGVNSTLGGGIPLDKAFRSDDGHEKLNRKIERSLDTYPNNVVEATIEIVSFILANQIFSTKNIDTCLSYMVNHIDEQIGIQIHDNQVNKIESKMIEILEDGLSYESALELLIAFKDLDNILNNWRGI